MASNKTSHADEARTTRWGPADVLAALAVVTIGAGIRLVHVAIPESRIFDEKYYAKDACLYADGSSSICGSAAEITGVHPPLGKWLIAVGIRGFGYNSLGWRIAAVAAGAVTIGILYMLARELLRSTLAATSAAGLLAIDPLHFVQSRVAMLDIFVPLFGLAAFYFLLLDRNRALSGASERARFSSLNRPWRAAAGIAAGAATASKWSGALIVVALIALSIAWETAVRRADGGASPARRALGDEGASILVWLIVTPVIVYAVSYAGVLEGTWSAAPWSEGSWARTFIERQAYMVSFHLGLDEMHSYGSPAWSWILIKRPVSYYFAHAGNGDYKEVFAAGNPVVWWSSIPALGYVGSRWLFRRSPAGPEGFILAGFLFTYGPWLLLASGRSAVFLFYLLPTVPFMCLALAYVLVKLVRMVTGRIVVALFAAACVLSFAFYYPLLAAVPLPPQEWQRRIWVFDNCDRPVPEEGSSASEDIPPPGWCWI